MKYKLEHLNFLTGISLFFVGVIYIFKSDYSSSLNWAIFGAMYLVMDSYKPIKRSEKRFNHHVRDTFGAIGFLLALILIIYVLI